MGKCDEFDLARSGRTECSGSFPECCARGHNVIDHYACASLHTCRVGNRHGVCDVRSAFMLRQSLLLCGVSCANQYIGPILECSVQVCERCCREQFGLVVAALSPTRCVHGYRYQEGFAE